MSSVEQREKEADVVCKMLEEAYQVAFVSGERERVRGMIIGFDNNAFSIYLKCKGISVDEFVSNYRGVTKVTIQNG